MMNPPTTFGRGAGYRRRAKPQMNLFSIRCREPHRSKRNLNLAALR
jgi:hypothetical protein